MKKRIKSVHIGFTENEQSHFANKTYRDLSSANSSLSAMARTAPNNGAYDKTDVTITWEDGSEYKLRFDLQRKHVMSHNPLGSDVASTARFYSGLHCPAHMTKAQYEQVLQYTTQETKNFYTSLLMEYDLGID